MWAFFIAMEDFNELIMMILLACLIAAIVSIWT